MSINFQERLKNLRKEKGVTQRDLAMYLKVGRPTVAGYETKGIRPNMETLVLIAEYFDVSTDYLLEITEVKKNEEIGERKLDKRINDLRGIDLEINELINTLTNKDKEEVKLFIEFIILRNEEADK